MPVLTKAARVPRVLSSNHWNEFEDTASSLDIYTSFVWESIYFCWAFLSQQSCGRHGASPFGVEAPEKKLRQALMGPLSD